MAEIVLSTVQQYAMLSSNIPDVVITLLPFSPLAWEKGWGMRGVNPL